MPVERKTVRPALRESYEALFHQVDVSNFFIDLKNNQPAADCLRGSRLERAIGVIYRPDTELVSHYFDARLSDQFDGVLHYDHSRAVEPLERTAQWHTGEVEETFPTGL
jgi:erythromycin esterase-like protein